MCRIVLVNSPINKNYIRSIRTGTYPPPSLGIIASFLKQHNKNVEILLLDGELLTHEEIINSLEADIVGISVNIMTYEAGLAIARHAKLKGATVVLGGPAVDPIGKKILQNRPYIDYVITGEGEVALSKLLNSEPLDKIPGLIYRKEKEIIENLPVPISLNNLAIPDYCDLPMEEYFTNYQERYRGFKPFTGSLAIFSRKGCIWREKTNGGCVFCMIPHAGMRFKTPENLWKEIDFYFQEYGINFFWEVSDTFSEHNGWLTEFIKKRPKHLEDIHFHIYARPNHITDRMAKLLKKLNVFEVFIGAESGDDQILKNSTKGCKVEHTYRAIEMLSKEGIYTILSFVFGLPGETKETLEKTVSLASEMVKYDKVIETSSSVLLPIPGSPAFKQMIEIPELKKKYDTDLFDLEELKKDWAKYFTNVSYEEIVDAKSRALELFPLNNTFSQIGKQSAPMC